MTTTTRNYSPGVGQIIIELDSLDASTKSIIMPAVCKVAEQLFQEGQTLIVLDLRNVNFLDSSGLGSLIGFQRTLKGRGQELLIINPTRPVRALFNLMRMDRVFTIVME